MAYQNIKAELKRFGVNYSMVADVLGMSVNNVSMKINERISMTVDEIKQIRQAFFPDASLEYLLVSDGDVPSKELRATARVESIADAMLDGHEDDPEVREIADELRNTAQCVDSERVLRILG